MPTLLTTLPTLPYASVVDVDIIDEASSCFAREVRNQNLTLLAIYFHVVFHSPVSKRAGDELNATQNYSWNVFG